MAKRKEHHKVAPKSPVEVTPPAVSPPGGPAADQSGLKWYQKKIMGVPMWVFLGIAGAIAAYFLYEYIADSSAGSSTTVPSSASTDPTGGTSDGGTGAAGGSGIVDPIEGNSGVGNAGPTVTGAPVPTTTTTPTLTPTPNASQANNPAYAGINLGGSSLTNLYPGQAGSGPSAGTHTAAQSNVKSAAHVQAARTATQAKATYNRDILGRSPNGTPLGVVAHGITTLPKPAPAPPKLPPEKVMIAQSKIKTAPKASAAKEAAGKAASISHAMTPR